jgi:hypothetical protein
MSLEKMMNKVLLLANLSLLALRLSFTLSIFAGVDDIKWQLVDTENNFTLYNADFPNSDILAIKGETVLDYPMEKVFTVFYDIHRQKEWVNRLKHAEIVQMKSFANRVVYTQGELPWPADDRDFLMNNTCFYQKEKKQLNCDMASIEDPKFPANKDSVHVRAIVLAGGFQLNDLGNNKTKIMVYIHGDPKGSIPTFIVNIIQSNWPKESISNLKKQLEKSDVLVYDKITEWFKTGKMPAIDKKFLSGTN